MNVPYSYLDRQFADLDAYFEDVRLVVRSGDFTLGASVTGESQRILTTLWPSIDLNQTFGANGWNLNGTSWDSIRGRRGYLPVCLNLVINPRKAINSSVPSAHSRRRICGA